MKKLAAFSVLGTALAAGLPGQAMAADFATVLCSNVFGGPPAVQTSQASAGATLPASCSGGSCSQCAADLLTKGFKVVNPDDVLFQNQGQPVFFFKRGD